MRLLLLTFSIEHSNRDAISRKCQCYINTFALLWDIKHHCFPNQMIGHSVYRTNMMQVSLQLESLFRDVVGLTASHRLPIVKPPTFKSEISDATGLIPIDDLPIWFSQHSSSLLIPHLQDLYELLKDLIQSTDKLASAPKKVRPDTVSIVGSNESRLVSKIIISGQLSPWSIKRSRTPSENVGIKERLVDSFFHQHKDLQQLCEIVVDRAIKNFAHSASHACILPLFKNEAASFEEYFSRSPRMILEDYTKLLDTLDSNAVERATTLMRDHLDRTITGTLLLLAPPETQPKVVEVALSLAMSHARQQGRNIIHSTIHQEKKKFVEEFVRKEKKFVAGVPLNASKRDRSFEGDIFQSRNSFHYLADLTTSLRLLQTTDTDDPADCDGLKEEAEKALEHLRQFFIGAGIPQTVLDFEMCLLSILKSFFANPLRLQLLRAVIAVADVLCLLGKLGYAESSKHELTSLLCDVDNMLILIESVNHGMTGGKNPLSYESIGNFLFVLLEESIICSRSLEAALLHLVVVKNEAKAVSKCILNKLALTRTGATDSLGGLVIMARLQRALSKDKVDP